MVRAFVVMMAMLGTGVMVSTPVGAEPAEREVVPASENAALVYWAGWYWLGEYRRTLSDLYYSEDGLFVPENQNEEEALRLSLMLLKPSRSSSERRRWSTVISGADRNTRSTRIESHQTST
ncbi:MAG: hypothetical protein ACFHWZ_02620 [Phycisphaerales bacterium]